MTTSPFKALAIFAGRALRGPLPEPGHFEEAQPAQPPLSASRCLQGPSSTCCTLLHCLGKLFLRLRCRPFNHLRASHSSYFFLTSTLRGSILRLPRRALFKSPPKGSKRVLTARCRSFAAPCVRPSASCAKPRRKNAWSSKAPKLHASRGLCILLIHFQCLRRVEDHRLVGLARKRTSSAHPP